MSEIPQGLEFAHCLCQGTAVFAIIILAFVKIPPMGSTVEADAEDPVLDTPTEEV